MKLHVHKLENKSERKPAHVIAVLETTPEGGALFADFKWTCETEIAWATDKAAGTAPSMGDALRLVGFMWDLSEEVFCALLTEWLERAARGDWKAGEVHYDGGKRDAV